ncbi:FtsK/SpoIIIE domain-containing protein [Streptomyces sp. MBT28]|uniref:FtsK/SpoIIIE domain-containing protein n=1 Tax=Streptomyces sp. MBT28 TaxID=1488357 RepID=UPI000619B8D1|nr:FtsK/SpoIIIE domain-containing protein [Streptomyces sp. MBT28]
MSSTATATKKQQASSGPVLDWAAGHGPVTGALSATTGAFAVATTGAATHMPPGWALAVGAAGALGHTVVGLRLRNAGRTLATRAASWLVGAGWTTWAMTHGPLTWTALGSLATIGVGIGAAARSSALFEEAREEEAIAAEQREIARELSAERRAIAAEWVERIQRICSISVRVVGVEMWPTGAGYSLDLEPQGGVTYDRIAQYSVQLSADARLPHGCTATAGPGIHQGRTIMDVTTVNVLKEDCPYPDDYRPLSVLSGLPWGVRTNGEIVSAYLREQCALVVGPTGSGKTNMVHTILAGFARAQDVLTWVIDLNAGSAGLPWVLPAVNGELTTEDGKPVRPGVDWLASSYEEAVLMLDAALAIGLHRKKAYQDLLAKANTDLLPISAKIPQILLVIDEGAEILVSTDRQMKQLAKKILEVIRMLRAMGIRTVLTALGATGSVLGNLMIRREGKVRVALTGGETEGMDLGKMFPGRRGLRVDQAPYKGSGFMGTPESPAALFKSWRILPNQIRDITVATSDRHPRLDDVSAKAAGPAYARRWDAERTAWMRDLTLTDADHGNDSDTGSGGLNLTALRESEAEQVTPEEAMLRKFREQIDAQFGTAPEPQAPEQSDGPPAVGGLNLSALRGEQDSPAQQAALALLLAAGREGTGASAIARALSDEHGTSRQTVVGWLRDWVKDGTAVRVGEGTKARYVHRQHAPEG